MFSDTNLLSQNPLQHVSFGNVSFPFIGSPSCPVFHSEAKFYILGFEFCISERAPSKKFLFQRPATLWLLGQTGRHSSL